jgi:predicted TIM-barrel fold metal-dependent hydrolase
MIDSNKHISRRALLAGVGACLLHSSSSAQPAIPVIDIHQHTNYSGRTDDALLAHQRTMGVTKTILLPSGYKPTPDLNVGATEICVNLATRHPKEFVYFGNEIPNIPTARKVLGKYLDSGAIGIGEQKFEVECDSPYIEMVASVAQEHGVPVLMHFQHERYNRHIERFHRILEKFPKVNFIGHAQTWWANIDRDCDQVTMYPKTRVTPGGITDKLLSDYPNMYGDMSASSGLNSMLRDEDHAHGFLDRHQNKLMFGSDCTDTLGAGDKCLGAQILTAVRRLAPDSKVQSKIFHQNASRIVKIKI